MPQLTRLFTPDPNTFPKNVTITSLSVDDLVKHCHEVGYVNARSHVAQNFNAFGSLTMSVQPTAIGAANTHTTKGEQDLMMLPPSPTDTELNCTTSEVLFEDPAGGTIISNATTVINGTGGIYPYNTTFDPTSHFDISFNPNSLENGGAWDAFDATTVGNGNDIWGIDWNAFVNDDSLA